MILEALKAIFAIKQFIYLISFDVHFLVRLIKIKINIPNIKFENKKVFKINVTLFDGMVCYLGWMH